VRAVIREACKLVLYRLRKLGVFNDTIKSLLRGKYGIEVGYIDWADNGWLERRLDFLLQQLLKINVPAEEWVFLDLVGAIGA